jgi:hypothetical protein
MSKAKPTHAQGSSSCTCDSKWIQISEVKKRRRRTEIAEMLFVRVVVGYKLTIHIRNDSIRDDRAKTVRLIKITAKSLPNKNGYNISK